MNLNLVNKMVDVCKNGGDNHLFQSKYKEVAPEEPDLENINELLTLAQRKKIVYKF